MIISQTIVVRVSIPRVGEYESKFLLTTGIIERQEETIHLLTIKEKVLVGVFFQGVCIVVVQFITVSKPISVRIVLERVGFENHDLVVIIQIIHISVS